MSLTPLGAHLEEDTALNWLFKLRGSREAPTEVVVVAIDKESAEQLGFPNEPHKWPRNAHARLTENLTRAGAKVIAYDLLFDKSREAEHDIELARAISSARNVVLVGYLKRKIIPGKAAVDELVLPIPAIADSAAAIAPFPLPKVPARVNGFWTFLDSGGEDSPAFPVVAFQLYASPAYEKLLDLLKEIIPAEAALLPSSANEAVSDRKVKELVLALRATFMNNPRIAKQVLNGLQSDDFDPRERRIITSLINLYGGSEMQYLNFYGPPRSIKTVPYSQALELSESAGGNFKGKTVFVGFAESLQPDQKDNYYTVFSQDSGLDLSGVEIAATAFANLLEDVPVRRLGDPAHLGIIFGFGLVAGIVCHFFSIAVGAVVLLALMLSYFAIAMHQFSTAGIWLPLFVPLLLQAPAAFAYAGLSKYRRANRERRNIRQAFGYYLPKNVVDQLAEKTHPVTATSQLVYGICLATDVERYTAVAEKMGDDPMRLSVLMNEYYRAVFRPVHKLGGIVSDVEGDAMLAIWAASNPDRQLKNRACEASLDIASVVSQFNQTSERPALCTRIGLDSGYLSLGSIGAGDHYEYRAVGDTVNSAHRIQGLNKQLHTCVLASQATLDGVEGFLTRGLGSFLLAGKSRAIEICELLCRSQDATQDQLWLCPAFADALESYRMQQWPKAQNKFLEILRVFPKDGPAQFYLELVERHKNNPSAASWNEGLIRIEGK
ncbi:MAG: CHASE2 domain-containing protein [Burkholderiales bacterium]